MEQKIPAISVIIPMYNAEKYIGACLESILAQTFKDFEIIIADDCSTDNSVAIVENYMKQGGGQLKLLRSKKNFGNPCVPRNSGLNISRGKYIYFMDNDDLLIKDALEKLYAYAENYNADVVCMHNYIAFEDASDKYQLKNPQLVTTIVNRKEIPVSLSENVAERINDFFQGKITIMPWLQFSKRDFLIENKIYFPEVLVSEDDFWFIHIICEAKKVLFIPNALYANRKNPNSLTRSQKTVEEKVKFHMTPTIIGMKCMSKLLKEEKFFQENPQYWYIWVSRMVNYGFGMIFNDCAKLQPHEVYKIIHEQFAQETGEHAELIAYLCSMINSQQKQLYIAGQKISELQKRLSAN